jgi:hypothetical protein
MKYGPSEFSSYAVSAGRFESTCSLAPKMNAYSSCRLACFCPIETSKCPLSLVVFYCVYCTRGCRLRWRVRRILRSRLAQCVQSNYKLYQDPTTKVWAAVATPYADIWKWSVVVRNYTWRSLMHRWYFARCDQKIEQIAVEGHTFLTSCKSCDSLGDSRRGIECQWVSCCRDFGGSQRLATQFRAELDRSAVARDPDHLIE